MYYKGKEVFYKKPINTDLQKAIIYDDTIEYYYKNTEIDEDPKYLGKFKSFKKYQSNLYYDNCDYIIIEFENDNIFENKKENIYYKTIPNTDADENMCIIEEMMYDNIYPVYYKK
jgi:hypothetical protein